MPKRRLANFTRLPTKEEREVSTRRRATTEWRMAEMIASPEQKVSTDHLRVVDRLFRNGEGR
jgi:hypothetical protein